MDPNQSFDFENTNPVAIAVSAAGQPPGPTKLEKFRRHRIPIRIGAFVVLALLLEFTIGISDRAMKLSFVDQKSSVAKILKTNGDIRYQPVEEDGWFKAETEGDVFSGDAIYSGTSSTTTAEMKSGGQVTLANETLVIFDGVDMITIPDETRGNIKLRISGDMRITLSGGSSKFASENAKKNPVMIAVADASRGKIQVVSGNARIQSKESANVHYAGEVIEYGPNTVSAAPIPTPEPTPEPAQVTALVLEEVALKPVESIPKIYHTLTKDEVYEQKVNSQRLFKRRGLKTVEEPSVLKWSGGNGGKTILQIARAPMGGETPDFANSWLDNEVTGDDYIVSKWRPGVNFWRVSQDGKTWSNASRVEVIPRFAIAREAMLVVETPVVEGPKAKARIRFIERSGRDISGWVLEGSRDAEFPEAKSKTIFVKNSKLIVPLSTLGKYHFRVRSVDGNGELSAFSPAGVVTVTRPQPKPQPKPQPILLTEKKEEPVRDVAAEEPPEDDFTTTKIRTSVKKSEQDFKRAGPWSVSLIGGLNAVISNVQTEEGGSVPPSVQVLGLEGEYFGKKFGATVGYRTRIGGVASGTGAAPSISRFDVRAARRWSTGFKPFRMRDIQLSWIVGLENYRNSEANFSSGYDLMKTGIGLNFDVTGRIQTGGTVLFGTWFDSNSKTEIDGYVNYDFYENLKMGLGYRIGMFEAGTVSASPIGLPYREAAGEAYSRVQFSF